MYEIRKTFTFEAAHWIAGLPEDHPCARLHGHSYRVEVVLASNTLDERGFLIDYGDLDPIRAFIDAHMDHRLLNDVLAHDQTSAEHIAAYLYHQFAEDFPELREVRVSETGKTWASYRWGAA